MPSFSSADPNAYLALGMQSAQGTPQVTGSKLRFAKYLRGNQFNVTPAVVDIREGGDGLNFGTSYKSRMAVDGTLTVYLRPDITGQFLQFLPGGATWNGASAPAVHTFHDNHASFPYGTMIVQHPGSTIQHLFSDMRFLDYQLVGRVGQPWQLTSRYRAIIFGASAVGLTPTYLNLAASYQDNLFLWHGNPSYVIDGFGDSTIEQVTISGQHGTDDLQAQSILLDDIVYLNRTLDVEVMRRYQSPSAWQKIAYSGVTNVAPTTSVPTGSLNLNCFQASMVMNIVMGMLTYRYDNLTELDPDGQTVKETISARALHTATAQIAITLSNNHASVYGP